MKKRTVFLGLQAIVNFMVVALLSVASGKFIFSWLSAGAILFGLFYLIPLFREIYFNGAARYSIIFYKEYKQELFVDVLAIIASLLFGYFVWNCVYFLAGYFLGWGAANLIEYSWKSAKFNL